MRAGQLRRQKKQRLTDLKDIENILYGEKDERTVDVNVGNEKMFSGNDKNGKSLHFFIILGM